MIKHLVSSELKKGSELLPFFVVAIAYQLTVTTDLSFLTGL